MNLKLDLTYIFVLQQGKGKALFRIFKTKSTHFTFSANNSVRNADFTRNQTNKTARAAAGCRPVGPAVAPPGVSDDPLNGDIRMRAQQLHITLLVGVAAGPDHQCGPVDNPRIAALRLDLVGDNGVITGFQRIEHLVDYLSARRREDQHRSTAPQASEDEREHLQSEKR